MKPETIAALRDEICGAIEEMGAVLLRLRFADDFADDTPCEIVEMADWLDAAAVRLTDASDKLTDEAAACGVICPHCQGVGDEPPPAVPLQDCDECGGSGWVGNEKNGKNEEGGK